jgi:hypothetical protein
MATTEMTETTETTDVVARATRHVARWLFTATLIAGLVAALAALLAYRPVRERALSAARSAPATVTGIVRRTGEEAPAEEPASEASASEASAAAA